MHDQKVGREWRGNNQLNFHCYLSDYFTPEPQNNEHNLQGGGEN